MATPLQDSLLVDLLARLLADRSASGLRPLDEYQALYPGHEASVAVEYEALRGAPLRARPDVASDTAGAPPRVAHFVLERELGRGGQGTVWLAFDERLGRRVALKVVPRSPLVEDSAPRFRREARIAGGLDHPSLCAVYDVGHDASVAWMALRYVEGESLAQLLRRGPLARDEALLVVERAARALHVAHDAGVVHRDVKPSNLMIAPGGEVVVLDFGVALPSEDGPPITLTGQQPGTPAYMAPEQFDGATGVDRRADVWALGVVLHEALTGSRPFAGATHHALVAAITRDESVPPEGTSRDLRVVLATALAKPRDRRYRTALDLAEDLRRLREGEPVLARPVGPSERLLRWAARRPAFATSLLVLALVVSAALVVTSVLLADTRRALDDFTRLSDLKLTVDLLAEERALWPTTKSQVPAMERWTARADAVLSREPVHRASLDDDEHLPRDAAARAWMVDQLGQLLDALPRLSEARSELERRLSFARDVDRLTLVEPAATWDVAARSVADDARFAGLALRPQRGLLPLGADPASGLQEFALLETGAPPSRDPESGALRIDESSSLVFVLVPGGDGFVGTDAAHDRFCEAWDGPRMPVRLDPFFVSKYETTQAQWLRHTGSNPSYYTAGWGYVSQEHPLLHPVEQVTWFAARQVAHELGLELPTEAQWEHAARAGSETPWWTGDSPRSLRGAANILDAFARDHGGSPAWEYETWLEDGGSVHVVVGSYRANAFGLHDTAGNVCEWCRDGWETWTLNPPRDGDGLAEGTVNTGTQRGGSYGDLAQNVRASKRNSMSRDDLSAQLGVRFVRALE